MTAKKIIKIDTAPDVSGVVFAIDSYDCDPEVVREFSRNYFGGKISELNITYRH